MKSKCLTLTIKNRLKLCWEILTCASGHNHQAQEKGLSTFIRGYRAGQYDERLKKLWLPMSTAPKDGRKIVIFWYDRYADDEEQVRIAYWDKPTEKMKQDGIEAEWEYISDSNCCHNIKNPAGWMPLP